MSNRKNSFDNKDRCNSKDSRSWSIGSIGSIGSIESIKMDDEEKRQDSEKRQDQEQKNSNRRRVREMNIGDHNRRNSPNPIYWKLLLIDFLKKTEKPE
jgi:hypothetical protein